MIRHVTIVGGVFALLACSPAPEPRPTPPLGARARLAPPKRTRPKLKIIRVKTADQFLDAIGSNRIIEMAPGTYRLDQAQKARGHHHAQYLLGGRGVVKLFQTKLNGNTFRKGRYQPIR